MNQKKLQKNSSKLLQILAKLTSEEVKGISLFIQSPYFATAIARKILEELLWFYPKFENGCLTNEEVFRRIFPDKRYDHKLLIKKFSEAYKVVESFLAHQLLKNNKPLLGRLKAMSLQEKLDFAEYDKFINKTVKAAEEKSSIYDDFDHQMLLQLQHYYPFSQKETTSFRTTPPDKANESIDYLYTINKLRFCCEYYCRASVYENTTGFTFKQEILAIAHPLKTTYPLIDFYLELINLLSETREDVQLVTFKKLKERFQQELISLKPTDKHIVFRCLTNFTIEQLRYNRTGYQRIQFELYQLGIDSQLLRPKGYLSPTLFMNMVNTAISSKEFNYALFFIENYSKQLKEKQQEDYKNLAFTYLRFYQKDYDSAQRHLNQLVKNKEIFHGLPVRFLELRLLFESFVNDKKNYRQLLEKYFKSFKNFVAKEKSLSDKRKQPYLNALAFLIIIRNALLYPNQATNSNFKTALIHQIESTELLFSKEYLLEKVAQIK